MTGSKSEIRYIYSMIKLNYTFYFKLNSHFKDSQSSLTILDLQSNDNIQGVSELISQTENLNYGPENKKTISYGAMSANALFRRYSHLKMFHCFELFRPKCLYLLISSILNNKNLLVVCKVALRTIILHDNTIRKH